MWTKEENELLLQMREDGVSYEQIGRMIGRSQHAVKQHERVTFGHIKCRLHPNSPCRTCHERAICKKECAFWKSWFTENFRLVCETYFGVKYKETKIPCDVCRNKKCRETGAGVCNTWETWFIRKWRHFKRMLGKSAEKHEREEIKWKEGRQ